MNTYNFLTARSGKQLGQPFFSTAIYLFYMYTVNCFTLDPNAPTLILQEEDAFS